MKGVFKSNEGLIVEEVPLPLPQDKEILVRVRCSVVSTGTETSGLKREEKSVYEKLEEKLKLVEKVSRKISTDGLDATIKLTWSVIKDKLKPSERVLFLKPVGYSNSGVVTAIGRGVANFNVGDRVACAGSGIAAHAEYVTIPVNLAVSVPDSVSLDDAAFTTVGSIAMQGVRRALVNPGETVVITGLGLLGLLAVQISKAWGLSVIGVDLWQERLELARSFGADVCFLASDKELEEKVMRHTSNVGADAVIIYAATKSSEPANQALRICRKKGRVVVVGAVGMNLERDPMYEKELDFVMSTSYGPGRYDDNYELKGVDYPIGYVRWTENRNMQEFIRLLAEKKIKTESLFHKRYTLDDAIEAYKDLLESPKDNITILFSYPEREEKEELPSKIEISPQPVPKEKINVGVIGAGGFIVKSHLPNILQLKEFYNLVAISTKTPAKAKQVGKEFEPAYVTNNYHEILNDDSIDMVLIGTRHDLHAKIAIEALNAGKHVFVEKPLALSRDEAEEIKNALRNKNLFLTVGFNRRYSSLSAKAREVLGKKDGPIFINYRVNAGYISESHWTQDPDEGGGRIIGECCHFLDLCNFLIDSEVEDIKVGFIPIDNRFIRALDNVAVIVSYKDGSLANLSYVSIGAESLEKERIEIFRDRTSMVISDFLKLEFFDIGEKDIHLDRVDKGFLRELEEFAKLLKGQGSRIIPLEQVFGVTEETFRIMDLIRFGQDLGG